MPVKNQTKHAKQRFLGMSIAILGMLLVSFDPIFIRFAGISGPDTVFLFGLFTAISMPILLKLTDKRSLHQIIKDCGWPLLITSLLMLASSSSFVLSVKHTASPILLLLCLQRLLFRLLLVTSC
jgi:hypothetical protein